MLTEVTDFEHPYT